MNLSTLLVKTTSDNLQENKESKEQIQETKTNICFNSNNDCLIISDTNNIKIFTLDNFKFFTGSENKHEKFVLNKNDEKEKKFPILSTILNRTNIFLFTSNELQALNICDNHKQKML